MLLSLNCEQFFIFDWYAMAYRVCMSMWSGVSCLLLTALLHGTISIFNVCIYYATQNINLHVLHTPICAAEVWIEAVYMLWNDFFGAGGLLIGLGFCFCFSLSLSAFIPLVSLKTRRSWIPFAGKEHFVYNKIGLSIK